MHAKTLSWLETKLKERREWAKRQADGGGLFLALVAALIVLGCWLGDPAAPRNLLLPLAIVVLAIWLHLHHAYQKTFEAVERVIAERCKPVTMELHATHKMLHTKGPYVYETLLRRPGTDDVQAKVHLYDWTSLPEGEWLQVVVYDDPAKEVPAAVVLGNQLHFIHSIPHAPRSA